MHGGKRASVRRTRPRARYNTHRHRQRWPCGRSRVLVPPPVRADTLKVAFTTDDDARHARLLNARSRPRREHVLCSPVQPRSGVVRNFITATIHAAHRDRYFPPARRNNATRSSPRRFLDAREEPRSRSRGFPPPADYVIP